MAKKGIPQDVLSLLADADKRNGLPAGTMLSIMTQEVGGKEDRFLADPGAYHYAPDAQGRRIAPHTGKVSTAFGPLGILESTAADPGFGVAPLKDKSLPEQIRFASDYVKARGLANYGEGQKYADQVSARVGRQGPDGAREQVATATLPPTQTTEAVAAAPVVAASNLPLAPDDPDKDPWIQFQRQVAARQEVTPQTLAYGQPATPAMPGVNVPAFNVAPNQGARPDFRSFLSMRKWA